MTGKRLDALTAKEWGLIWEVSDNCLDDAVALAEELAQMPSEALVTLREVMSAACQQGLDSQLELETRRQSALGKSPDFIEAVNAFMEKRPPVFKD